MKIKYFMHKYKKRLVLISILFIMVLVQTAFELQLFVWCKVTIVWTAVWFMYVLILVPSISWFSCCRWRSVCWRSTTSRCGTCSTPSPWPSRAVSRSDNTQQRASMVRLIIFKLLFCLVFFQPKVYCQVHVYGREIMVYFFWTTFSPVF